MGCGVQGRLLQTKINRKIQFCNKDKYIFAILKSCGKDIRTLSQLFFLCERKKTGTFLSIPFPIYNNVNRVG